MDRKTTLAHSIQTQRQVESCEGRENDLPEKWDRGRFGPGVGPVGPAAPPRRRLMILQSAVRFPGPLQTTDVNLETGAVCQ